MNLRQIEILRAVMQFRTTTGAAHELGMSQPSVSTAIKHMEAQLGFPLFDRVSNRLVPTDEARLLAAESEPLFRLHRAVRQKAVDLRTGQAGRLRLVATAELSDALLPGVMARFAAARPAVKIGLETLTREEMLDQIEMGAGDLGFAMEPSDRPGLVLTPLAELEMVFACPAGSPLAGLPFVTPADLSGERLIASVAGTRIHEHVARAFRQSRVLFEPAIEVRFMNAAIRLVQAGYGACCVDPLTARAVRSGEPNDAEGIVVRPFRPRIPLALCAVRARDRVPQRLARAFLHDIGAALRAERLDSAADL